VVVRILRDDGPDLLTFTEAGGLARSGFNSAGIAITANYLESDRDYRELGIPLPFIRPPRAGGFAFRAGAEGGGDHAEIGLQQHDAEHRRRLMPSTWNARRTRPSRSIPTAA
jgi:hypothetical protein